MLSMDSVASWLVIFEIVRGLMHSKEENCLSEVMFHLFLMSAISHDTTFMKWLFASLTIFYRCSLNLNVKFNKNYENEKQLTVINAKYYERMLKTIY